MQCSIRETGLFIYFAILMQNSKLRQGLRCWTVKHTEHTVNTVKHKDWGVLGNFRQNLRLCLQTLRELCEALQNTIAMRFPAKH